MLTIKLDNQVSLTQATESLEETPYIRGTVVAAEDGFEAAEQMRVRIFGDTNPTVLEHAGKFVTRKPPRITMSSLKILEMNPSPNRGE